MLLLVELAVLPRHTRQRDVPNAEVKTVLNAETRVSQPGR